MDGLNAALLSSLALQVQINYIMKTKGCFHNRMDGLKAALLSSLALQVQISYIIMDYSIINLI